MRQVVDCAWKGAGWKMRSWLFLADEKSNLLGAMAAAHHVAAPS
jgi:hypothetical protein